MNFLFWNTKKKNLNSVINEINVNHNIDVIMISEPYASATVILREINKLSQSNFSYQYSPVGDPLIFAKLPTSAVKPLRDLPGMSIRNLIPPIGSDIIIVTVHLPSKLHYNDVDQALYVTELIKEVEEVEENIGHRRTIIVGDFNMNPFDLGIISAQGFHAIMDKKIARKKFRTIKGNKKYFFYNPMWLQYNNSKNIFGTYYYNISKPINYFWNMFDQVIIRPELFCQFDDNEVLIITESFNHNLLNKHGIPNKNQYSDHLPLKFSIDLLKGEN